NGEPLAAARVLVAAQEENGVLVLRMKTADEGRVSFEGIRAERVQLIVYDDDFNAIASRTLALASHSTTEAEIRIGEEPGRVHVSDTEGAPLPSAWVTVRSADGAEILALDDTGVDGWADLVGLPPRTLLMDVDHGIAGWCHGVSLDATVKEHEFVLDAKGS